MQKLQDSGGKKILPRKASLPEEKETDLEVRRKRISKSAEGIIQLHKKNCIFRREKHLFIKLSLHEGCFLFLFLLTVKSLGEWPNYTLPYSYFMLLVPGRIELKGTTSQKLAQLQEREIELLEERDKQRKVIEQLKEDRAHYRSVADDLR